MLTSTIKSVKKNTMNTMLRKERILIVQPYGIGDTIFMLPLLKAFRLQRNVEYIDCILGPRTTQLLGNIAYLDKIFVIDKDRWQKQGKLATLFDKIKILAALKKRKYTTLLDFSMQPEYSFWGMFYLAIPVRAGFNYRRRNSFLTHPLHLPQEGFVDKHVIEYFSDLGRLLGVSLSDKNPEIPITSGQLAAANKLLSNVGQRNNRYIVVSPGGGVTWGSDALFKHWPVEYFAELIKMIHSKISFDEIVVLGLKSEELLGEYLKKNLNIKVLNLCGKTNLLEAAALMKTSLLFLGNDGGLVHLASSQNIPIIAFYGPADWRVYGAYPDRAGVVKLSKGLECQPCYRNFRYNRNCSTLACLKNFTPQEAFDKLMRINYLNNLPQK